MYSMDARVRYSEIDSEGFLTLKALLNYFQDSSTFHSQDAGLGMARLKEKNRVWVLASWHVVIDRYPRICEKLKIITMPYEFKGFLGFRNFAMIDEEGNYIAKASTLWSLLDTTTMKPTFVDEEIVQKLPLEPKLDMEYAPRKIDFTTNMQMMDPIPVQKSHLDTNYHVNNGQYVDIAKSFLPGDFQIKMLRTEYKKQAVLGDVFYPRVGLENGKCVVSLENESGDCFSMIEFS